MQVRLRRLLLFLGAKKSASVRWICQLPPNTLLPLLLRYYLWRFGFSGDWLLDRLTAIVSSSKMFNRLLQQLDARFMLIPDNCLT